MSSSFKYEPSVFDVRDEAQAMAIILTPEDGVGTEERWQVETPYLAQRIVDLLNPGTGCLALDFGCGIGRLSRELIARTDCKVIGVDISANMRLLATQYVSSDRFTAVSPDMLDALIARGLKVEVVVACWVLQHCNDASSEIARLAACMHAGSRLLVVNNFHRALPTDHGWIDDGCSVKELLANRLLPMHEEELPLAVTTPSLHKNSFVAVYRTY